MLLRFTDNLIMQLTRDCNLHCKYCFQGDKKEWANKFVTYEEFKQIVDTTLYERCILGDRLNYVNFHFHGGEILLYPWEELKKMIDYIYQRKRLFPNITFCMQTNGLGLTEEICKYFKDREINISLSFDGYGETDRMSATAAQLFSDKLKNLHEKTGVNFSCLTVLSRNNMKTWFEDIKKFKEQTGTTSLGINPICTLEEDDDLMLSEEELWMYWAEPILKTYLTDKPFESREMGLMMEATFNDLFFSISEDATLKKTGCFNRLCGHGSNMIGIDPNLNLTSCDKYLEKGDYINLREETPLTTRDFLGLQQVKKVLAHYKALFEQEKIYKCDECIAKHICIGQCQAISISKYGKVTFDKKDCFIYPKIYNFFKDNYKLILLQNSFFAWGGRITGLNPFILEDLNKNGLKIVISENGEVHLEVKE